MRLEIKQSFDAASLVGLKVSLDVGLHRLTTLK